MTLAEPCKHSNLTRVHALTELNNKIAKTKAMIPNPMKRSRPPPLARVDDFCPVGVEDGHGSFLGEILKSNQFQP